MITVQLEEAEITLLSRVLPAVHLSGTISDTMRTIERLQEIDRKLKAALEAGGDDVEAEVE